MRGLLAALIVLAAPRAAAEAPVKLVVFTATWCPLCHILDPKIEEAASRAGGAVDLVRLDLTTAGDGASPAARRITYASAAALARRHGVDALWARYEGVTGFGAIVAADTGELIDCVAPADDPAEIWRALELAARAVGGAAPDRRIGVWSPTGCPE